MPDDLESLAHTNRYESEPEFGSLFARELASLFGDSARTELTRIDSVMEGSRKPCVSGQATRSLIALFQEWIVIALALILSVVAFASWAYAVFCVFQALRRFKPDVSPWSRKFLDNPMNAVVFNPGVLTPDGAIYLKRAAKALAMFFLALLAGIVAGSIESYLAKLE